MIAIHLLSSASRITRSSAIVEVQTVILDTDDYELTKEFAERLASLEARVEEWHA